MYGQRRFALAMPKEEICYVSWTIDAYEGLGVLSTEDASRGLVSIYCPREMEPWMEKLILAFEDEGISIERQELT